MPFRFSPWVMGVCLFGIVALWTEYDYGRPDWKLASFCGLIAWSLPHFTDFALYVARQTIGLWPQTVELADAQDAPPPTEPLPPLAVNEPRAGPRPLDRDEA